MLRCARNDGVCGTSLFFHALSSRRRTCAFSRLLSPELCCSFRPRKTKGRREGRAPAGTRGSACIENAHGVDHRCCRSPGLPCADGFNGVLRALPGERCTIAPVASPLVRCTHPVGHHASPRDLTPATGRQDHTTSPSADGQPGSVKGWRVLTPDVQPGRCDRAVSYRVAHDSTGCPSLSSHFRAGATASTAPRPASRDDREAPLWQGPG